MERKPFYMRIKPWHFWTVVVFAGTGLIFSIYFIINYLI